MARNRRAFGSSMRDPLQPATNSASRRAVHDESRKQSGTQPILRDEKARRDADRPSRGATPEDPVVEVVAEVPAPPEVLDTVGVVSRSRRLPEALVLATTGSILVTLFVLQALIGFEWEAVTRWQRLEWYKVSTGLVLALFVAGQWVLPIARINGWQRLAKVAFTWHQRTGLLAPLLLFAHSTSLGYGYLAILSALYLGSMLTGLWSPRSVASLRAHYGVWLVNHIAVAVALIVMAAYHVWMAMYFE